LGGDDLKYRLVDVLTQDPPASWSERSDRSEGAFCGRGRSTPTHRAAGRAWPSRVASCSTQQRPPPALGCGSVDHYLVDALMQDAPVSRSEGAQGMAALAVASAPVPVRAASAASTASEP
jgi:hypothetical protein